MADPIPSNEAKAIWTNLKAKLLLNPATSSAFANNVWTWTTTNNLKQPVLMKVSQAGGLVELRVNNVAIVLDGKEVPPPYNQAEKDTWNSLKARYHLQSAKSVGFMNQKFKWVADGENGEYTFIVEHPSGKVIDAIIPVAPVKQQIMQPAPVQPVQSVPKPPTVVQPVQPVEPKPTPVNPVPAPVATPILQQTVQTQNTLPIPVVTPKPVQPVQPVTPQPVNIPKAVAQVAVQPVEVKNPALVIETKPEVKQTVQSVNTATKFPEYSNAEKDLWIRLKAEYGLNPVDAATGVSFANNQFTWKTTNLNGKPVVLVVNHPAGTIASFTIDGSANALPVFSAALKTRWENFKSTYGVLGTPVTVYLNGVATITWNDLQNRPCVLKLKHPSGEVADFTISGVKPVNVDLTKVPVAVVETLKKQKSAGSTPFTSYSVVSTNHVFKWKDAGKEIVLVVKPDGFIVNRYEDGVNIPIQNTVTATENQPVTPVPTNTSNVTPQMTNVPAIQISPSNNPPSSTILTLPNGLNQIADSDPAFTPEESNALSVPNSVNDYAQQLVQNNLVQPAELDALQLKQSNGEPLTEREQKIQNLLDAAQPKQSGMGSVALIALAVGGIFLLTRNK